MNNALYWFPGEDSLLALIMNIAAKGLTLGSTTDVQHVVLGPSRQDLNQFEHRFHSLEDLNNENPFQYSNVGSSSCVT